MGPFGVVECDPVFDDPPGLEAVADFFEGDRLLFQGSPKAFDEDVVQVSTAPIH